MQFWIDSLAFIHKRRYPRLIKSEYWGERGVFYRKSYVGYGNWGIGEYSMH
jgi:hypothetical protein